MANVKTSKSKKNKNLKINFTKLGLELLVVFLGVTAGFVLNNYKQTVQEKKLEENYLKSFLVDVNQDIEQLKNMDRNDSLFVESADTIIKIIKGKRASDTAILRVLTGVFSFDKAYFQTATYEDIISSGNLNLINNYGLRSQLVEYNLACKNIGFVDDFVSDFFSDYIIPFMQKEFDLTKMAFVDPKMKYSVELANLVLSYQSFYVQRMAAYDSVISGSYKLKEALEIELEK